MQISNSKRKSRLAIWISGIYLVLALGSWLLPVLAGPEESMAGVFLILFAQPWASVWMWIYDQLQLESMWPGMAFMLLGILFNAWLIYRLILWLSGLRHRD